MNTNFQAENISTFLDGEMSEEQARVFLAAIERNPEASAELQRMLKLRELIADACRLEPAAAALPPTAQARWQEAIRREAALRPAAASVVTTGTPNKLLRPPTTFWRAAASMAATVLVAAGVLWYIQRSTFDETPNLAGASQMAPVPAVALNDRRPPPPPASPVPAEEMEAASKPEGLKGEKSVAAPNFEMQDPQAAGRSMSAPIPGPTTTDAAPAGAQLPSPAPVVTAPPKPPGAPVAAVAPVAPADRPAIGGDRQTALTQPTDSGLAAPGNPTKTGPEMPAANGELAMADATEPAPVAEPSPAPSPMRPAATMAMVPESAVQPLPKNTDGTPGLTETAPAQTTAESTPLLNGKQIILHIPHNDQNVVLIRRWVENRGGKLQVQAAAAATDTVPSDPLSGPAFLGLVRELQTTTPPPVLKVTLPEQATAELQAYVRLLEGDQMDENVRNQPPAAAASMMEMQVEPSQNDTTGR